MEWVVNVTPRPLYPREKTGIYCIGGRVGPRAGLNGGEGNGISFPPGFDTRAVQPMKAVKCFMAYLYNLLA
jgi:hypothetical protein